MVGCFVCALDFGQSNNTFYGISAYFKRNFCLTPRLKINCPRWFFFNIYRAEIFEFVYNPRCKVGWLPGYLDRVFVLENKSFQSTHANFETKKVVLLLNEFAESLL